MEIFEGILSQQIVEKLGWVLVHFLWQGIAVAILAAVVLRLLKNSSSNIRYAVACMALAVMVILPIATFQMVEIASSSRSGTSRNDNGHGNDNSGKAFDDTRQVVVLPVVENNPQQVIALPEVPLRERFVRSVEPVLPYAVLGWLVGVAGLSLWYLGGWTQLQRLRKRMVKPVCGDVKIKLKQLSQKLGISRAVDIVESAIVNVPTVIGCFKPIILLPATALTGLSGEQIAAILAHELAHIKRCDYLVNILQTVVEILGFYHPAVWWVSNKIRYERENCCDDIAVKVTGDNINYAQALATMEEIRSLATENTEDTEKYKLSVAASGGNLFNRICRLLGKDSASECKASWLPSVIAVILIGALAVTAVMAVTKASEPQSRKGTKNIATPSSSSTTPRQAENTEVKKSDSNELEIYEVNKNVLDNSGAEKGKGDLPSLWFKASIPAEGLKMYRDTENVHSGKYSLAITNTHKYEQTVCNNWAQDIGNISVGSAIKVSAYIKTENADSVNVCIQCWDISGKNMLAFTSTNTLRGDNDWILLESPPVLVPVGTVKVTVRAVLTGTGKVWFDDINVNTAEQTETIKTTEGTENKRAVVSAFNEYITAVRGNDTEKLREIVNRLATLYNVSDMDREGRVRAIDLDVKALRTYKGIENLTIASVEYDNQTTLTNVITSHVTDARGIGGKLEFGFIGKDEPSLEAIHFIEESGKRLMLRPQVLTTAYILSVRQDWAKLKELFPEKKFNSFTPEKLEEFLKVVKADKGTKILHAPMVLTNDGQDAVMKNEGIEFKIKNKILPGKKSINAEFELKYMCGVLQKTSGGISGFLPSNHALVVRGGEPCDGNEIILIVQPKVVEAEKAVNVSQVQSAKDSLGLLMERSTLMKRRDILQKTLHDAEMSYNAGRADSKQLGQAKIDLLRVEIELSETPQKRIELLSQIVTIYAEQEKTTKLFLDAGRATLEELNKAELLRLNAENELAKAKAEILATPALSSTTPRQAENTEIKKAEAIKKAEEPKQNWRQNFDKIYRLENDSVLKRISPPFIPERREYYKTEVSYQASAIPEPPSYFTFHWDGSLKMWGLGFGGKETLYLVLSEHFSIGADKLDVPEELMRIEVPGDWIVRKNSTVEQKLKALEKILSEEIGKDIHFEKREVVRAAVVANGKFKFHPPSETYEHESVHLYSDKLDADESSGGGTADSVSDFLNKLANIINMPVIDETRNSEEIEIPYRHHSSSYLRSEKYDTQKKRKLDMLLVNLNKQTELQFKIEKRPVEIWFVTETPADPAAFRDDDEAPVKPAAK